MNQTYLISWMRVKAIAASGGGLRRLRIQMYGIVITNIVIRAGEMWHRSAEGLYCFPVRIH